MIKIGKFLTILIVMIVRINRTSNSSITLIKQYYECKNLKMIKQESHHGIIYLPDPSVAKNRLDDSFYERLGFANMTFDEAMELVKKIYNESTNDPTKPDKDDFRTCVRSYARGDRDDHSEMFRNETILEQAKHIVSLFIKKNKKYTLPEREIQRKFREWRMSFAPALIKFLVNNDYSLDRIDVYDTKLISFFPDETEHNETVISFDFLYQKKKKIKINVFFTLAGVYL